MGDIGNEIPAYLLQALEFADIVEYDYGTYAILRVSRLDYVDIKHSSHVQGYLHSQWLRFTPVFFAKNLIAAFL